ncbi:MAG TPA: CvpA family protein [Thermomicrobiales bacterium]|nr:CvpA family protein [Thermomicrobiales bacterium]
MSIFLVLDVLLVLLIALFTPIGFWRGPVKELFVTLGIIFGILLADFWARPWGRDLSDLSDLTAGSGAFIVAMCFLVASTFILGYGIGAALGPAYHSTEARLLGAVIAALNGTLLLSFALQYVRLYLLSDANEESLNDSYVSQFLLDQIGWVLMVAAIVAVPLLLYILISGRRAYELIYDDGYDDYVPVPAPPRQSVNYERARAANAATSTLPPRVPGPPREADQRGYKAEPEPRPQRATAETRPLVVSEPDETAEPAPMLLDTGSDQPRPAFSDTDPHIVIPAEARRPAQPETPSEPDQPEATAQPASVAASPEPQPTPEPPAASERTSDLAPGYERCRTCHAVLAPGVTICPNCGTVR